MPSKCEEYEVVVKNLYEAKNVEYPLRDIPLHLRGCAAGADLPVCFSGCRW